MKKSFDLQTDSEEISSLQHNSVNLDPQESDLFEEVSLKGSKKAYRCIFPNCGKLFNYKSETTRHTLIHQRGRPHTCPYEDCGKTFKRNDALKNHLHLHEQVLPYLCDMPECGKRFATKAAIRYHKIKHENQRDYICDFSGCNKTFLTISQLKQHQSALNVHSRKSTTKTRQEEEPRKIHKTECNESNEDPTEIPKLLDYVQWETRSQNNEGNISYANNPAQNFETVYAYLIKENQILKEKMQERQKLVNIQEKKLVLGFPQLECQIPPLQTQDFSLFLNNNEMKFLDFLRGQESSGQ